MRLAKTKKHYYWSLLASVAIISHMIGGIIKGRQSLPGRDIFLAENPESFWFETCLFLGVGFGVLIHSCYRLLKLRKSQK
jgi:hypothetical protein